jgi:hypothetical protein
MQRDALLLMVATVCMLAFVVSQISTHSSLFQTTAIGEQVSCSSPANNQTNKAVSSELPKAHPQFVFLVGTEGSGHHLWSTLIEKSPHFQALQKLTLIPAANNITFQLFSKLDLQRSLFAGAACDEHWNGTLLVEQTAQQMKLVASKLPSDITIPLNGITSSKRISGMMSYPNYRSTEKCAGFRHPDLSLLQQACDMANVACHYIVQYRDPIAILRSTVQNRGIHNMGYAIPLYSSMLSTIRFQMQNMPPDALEFCWDYNQGEPPAQLRALLGWKDRDEFATFFRQEYRPTSVGSQDKVVPNQYSVLLPSLLAAYEQLKATCQATQ